MRITDVIDEAEGIRSFRLQAENGGELPPFTPGAHINIRLGAGLVRQYSLAGDSADNGTYRVAVLREDQGRGGSKAIHAVVAGDTLGISTPRNNFPLAGFEASFHLLIAGGIGITPMLSMIAELERRKAEWLLHYCTRSRERTAFREELQPLVEAGKVVLHHDGGDPAKGLDIAALLAEYQPGHHVYVCGPKGMMQIAKAAVGAWPPHCVHFEHFAATELTSEDAAWDKKPFKIKIARTGQVVNVPARVGAVDALRNAGYEIETSCLEGYCGTCITRYTEGDPVHRDTVLSAADRKSYVMLCRARSRSRMLVIDI
ncbi:MAG: PDR/VanB family oxidoreductase [Hyphomicrobiaceae bacterium]|nr:PDR/VanB family oxidoreductase [Hyphomicrobiaceae bacterium]